MSQLSVTSEPYWLGYVQPSARPEKVHRSIYLDADTHDAEMANIFARTWVYVGHESEIPGPGDFQTRWIGNQPVILTRDAGGQVRVLLNRCSHRAAVVCHEASGTTKHFRCGYHGWTFRTDGTLIGATYADGYRDGDLDGDELSLGAAPRVDSYRGLVFASLSSVGQSLGEHLGHAREFLDLFCDLSPSGDIAMTKTKHRYSYPGNWKLQTENGVDAYHAGFVHAAYLETVGGRDNPMISVFHGQSDGESVALGNGHSALDFRPQLGDFFERMIRRNDEGEDYYQSLVDRLGHERATEVVRTNGGLGFNILIYPNLLIIQTQLRVMHPRGVTSTEVDLHPTTLVGAPDSINQSRLRGHEGFYGPAGGGAPDDLEMFRRVADGLAVSSMEWLRLHRGMGRARVLDDGREVGHITDEGPQREFYRQWHRDMTQ